MNNKDIAYKLRREGKSYNEISKALGVAKSTLSDWLKGEHFSKRQKEILSKEARRQSILNIKKINTKRSENLEKHYLQARNEAKTDFVRLKDNPLFIAGISIYWGEGDRASKNGFRIGNIDPQMIKLFNRFLIEVCTVDKNRIRAWVLLYPDLVESTCLNYWRNTAGLKDTIFTKSIRIKGKSGLKKLTYGVCYLSYSSRYLKEKMLVWIDLLSKI